MGTRGSGEVGSGTYSVGRWGSGVFEQWNGGAVGSWGSDEVGKWGVRAVGWWGSWEEGH